ncbi:unnamed protein product [Ilex paraguariensis]|uniref:Pleiotropic ABC efflux transporter N-terminal domain-containing protein n=1 Tax=Ilex paraguariensis TaxID=185542 RepID=A0ABC8S9E8_9AQUA
MEAGLPGKDMRRSIRGNYQNRRMSFASPTWSWDSLSVQASFSIPGGEAFDRSSREYDEEELMWAAIERLPTFSGSRKGILRPVSKTGRVFHKEVDAANLGMQDKRLLMESTLKVVEDDNERFLQSIRDRIDRVGIDIPKIEVRFEHLAIEGDAYVGSRALPTLLNATLNVIEKHHEKHDLSAIPVQGNLGSGLGPI